MQTPIKLQGRFYIHIHFLLMWKQVTYNNNDYINGSISCVVYSVVWQCSDDGLCYLYLLCCHLVMLC